MAPIRRLSQRGPFQSGASDLGFRLDPRTINLVLFIYASTLAEADSRRDEVAEIFKPRTSPVRLRCTRDDGEVREIHGFTEGILDFPDTPDQDRLGPTQRLVVPILCPDPIWFDPTPRLFWFTNLGTSTFAIPMAILFNDTLTSATLNFVGAIDYGGAWQEFPLIRITGPANGLEIINVTTDENLSFGTNIASSEVVEIDLRYEYKTITSSTTGNAESYLTEDSDKATWHLEPGSNVINIVTTGAATSATAVSMTYYHRYLSL
jgi:hypothetical protein